MPIVRKLIEGWGDDTPAGLTFGLGRLRHFQQMNPQGSFAEKWPVGNAMVHVNQVGPIQTVRVVDGGKYFEFLTSGKPVETFVTTGTVIPFTGYKAAVVCVTADTKGATATIGNGEKAEYTVPNSPLGRPAQLGLIDEPVAYSGTRLIYEGFPPVSPHTGVWLRSYITASPIGSLFDTSVREPNDRRGSYTPFTFRDIDFDIPFMVGAGKTVAQRGYIREDADWPRANGVQSVTHPVYGTRTFGIYNDAFGQFFFFPLAQMTAPDGYNQNVLPLYVKRYRPTLPAWCFTSDKTAMQQYTDEGANGMVLFPDTDWKFRHDGTKACAVVFERRAANFDSAYFTEPSTIGPSPFTSANFIAYRDVHMGALSKLGDLFASSESAANYKQFYSVAPGVVELTFTITLTGPDPENYTVDIGVEEIRRPTSSAYFTVLAGYSWVDVRATDWTEENQRYDARKGDMVTLDLELHYKPRNGPNEFRNINFLALKNLSQDKEIRAFPGALHQGTNFPDGRELRSYELVDFDLPTLSFALRLTYNTVVSRTVGVTPHPITDPTPSPATTAANFTVTHFGIQIYTLNRYRETLYPEAIDTDARAEIESRGAVSGRAIATDGLMELIPLSRIDNWTVEPYKTYRDWYCSIGFGLLTGRKAFTPPITDPGNTVENLVFSGTNGDGLSRFLITDPCHAWQGYGRVLAAMLHTTEQSTFFAHPSGTWAFYDHQYIYNRWGIPRLLAVGGTVAWDTYTAFDLAYLEHVIFDKVHFSGGVNSTFRELYNAAVAKGITDGTLVADLQPITIADLRATFTKNAAVFASAPYSPTYPTTALLLGITWGGVTAYTVDGAYTKSNSRTSLLLGNAWGLADMSLGGNTYTIDLATKVDLFNGASPIKFSSAVQV